MTENLEGITGAKLHQKKVLLIPLEGEIRSGSHNFASSKTYGRIFQILLVCKKENNCSYFIQSTLKLRFNENILRHNIKRKREGLVNKFSDSRSNVFV
jgi:hypothetical protein